MTLLTATLIDHSLSLLGGVLGLLLGYRVMGPQPGTNPQYEAFYLKWGRHLKWLGPLVIVFALLQIAMAIIGRG